jgi:transposase
LRCTRGVSPEQPERAIQVQISIRGVGDVLALSWVLEIAEVKRFASLRQAVSYCGLCAAQRESAGKSQACRTSSRGRAWLLA